MILHRYKSNPSLLERVNGLGVLRLLHEGDLLGLLFYGLIEELPKEGMILVVVLAEGH